MAFCPSCKGVMGFADKVCPHCGHDFPPSPDADPQRSRAFPYSPVADIALIAATVAAAAGCLVAVFIGISALAHREYFGAFVYSPIAFFIQLGIVVAFLRIQLMDRL
jgi:hypothetical protein